MPKVEHPGQETRVPQLRKSDNIYLLLQLYFISVTDDNKIWGLTYIIELIRFVVKPKFPEPVFLRIFSGG